MSGTILLADDSLTIQKVVELTFADTENSVITVSSGDELLERLPEVAPDLVICDVIMPGTDGYSVCQTIKSDPSTLHIPVILLTGTFEPFDKDRALAAGCDEIITKPFEARKLVDTVEGLLQRTLEPPVEASSAEHPVGPSRFEGAVVPPQPGWEAPVAEEFGTRLASAPEAFDAEPAAAGEEIDFTTTGFAEMEEAGRTGQEEAYQAPSEGLEFGLDEVEHQAEPGTAVPEPARDSVASPFAPAEAAGAEERAEEPFSPAEEAVSEAAAPPPLPYGAEPGEPFEEAAPPLDQAEEPPIGSVTTPVAIPPTGTFQEAAFDNAATVEDTGGRAAPPASPAPTATEESRPVAETAGAVPVGSLADEDVERIARRVVELFAARLEQIAWEVIPDVAEIVVRERVRQIEAEAEKAQPEATY